jgi:DNA-binding MarR family transcriptional regulator
MLADLVELPIRLPPDEIDRLIHVLMKAQRSGTPSMAPPFDANVEKLASFASFLLHLRRRREVVLADVEFGEPAWDMLLDLYVQHVDGAIVSVSSLCFASAVPVTTALRWIDAMARKGVFLRYPDLRDGRRVNVRLAPSFVPIIEAYLAEMRGRALAMLQ